VDPAYERYYAQSVNAEPANSILLIPSYSSCCS